MAYIIIFNSFGQIPVEQIDSSKASKKSVEEKRGEELKFNEIQKVLKNDFLEKNAQNRQRRFEEIKSQRESKNTRLYDYPQEKDIWSFLAEIWLIRNVDKLKWNFEKPDYGLRYTLERTFEKFGYIEKKIKLLLINTPEVTHFCIPGDRDEYIFLLSVPFIRTMDLTKREISILLFEDYIRQEKGYFKKYAYGDDLKKVLGKNFRNDGVNLAPIDETLKKMSYFIFEKGFSFQQQFEVTKSVSSLLKSDLNYWNSYLSLLGKIDNLIKNNELYKDYTKKYPSPELQLKWILPKKKVL